MYRIVYALYRLSHMLYLLKTPVLPYVLQSIIRIVFSAVIPYSARIGKKTMLAYGGLGVVLHRHSEIGEHCIIAPGVTIGGTSRIREVPRIGNRVLIGTGARILGPVTIGDDVVIGANAVVLDNVPARCMVAGVPAKIIKKNIEISDYNDFS